jgi:hypothetical protein
MPQGQLNLIEYKKKKTVAASKNFLPWRLRGLIRRNVFN